MKPLIHLILLAISLLLLAVPIADSSVIDTLPWKDIQYMFVLYNVPFDFATDPSSGDSYSSVGYSPAGTHPSSANPIGNPAFPGKTTAYGANWVGWLTTAYNESILLTYDFAVSGSLVQDAVNQIRTQFLPYLGHGPSWAPWTNNTSLFVTWIGNNDVFRDDYDINSQLQLMFRWEEVLQSWGATNFLFINVNPYDRSPSANTSISDLGKRIADWNAVLPTYVANFTSVHPGVTASLYDVNTLFQTVLDNPEKYGFKDATSYCGNSNCIWADEVHATYAMHHIIAAKVAQLLGNQDATIPTGSSGAKHSPSFAAIALLPLIVFFVVT